MEHIIRYSKRCAESPQNEVRIPELRSRLGIAFVGGVGPVIPAATLMLREAVGATQGKRF